MAIDYQFLPATQTGYDQEFAAPGTWQIWEKPKGVVSVYVLVVGSGNAGGNGFSDAVAAGGGGGGGSGGINRFIFPADLLPDTLYIYCGRPGERSFVAAYPDSTVAANLYAASGDAAAGVGGNGAAAGSAAAGAAETVLSAASAPFQSLANRTVVAGDNGALGGIPNFQGNPGAQMTGKVLTGGGSGGGVTAAGAAFRIGGAVNNGPEINILGGAADGQVGADGPMIQRPWQPLSGAGGASSLLGPGGAGGKGWYGCGGGGGGGTLAGAGGAGGVGGGGYVLMVCL